MQNKKRMFLNEIIFILIIFLKLFSRINCNDINIVSFQNSRPVPPQPSQVFDLIKYLNINLF